jgi:hypothetical protein
MALTATATEGFELIRHTTENEVLWLPTDPGVTYTKGDFVAYSWAAAGSQGLPILSPAASAQLIGTVLKTTVAPSIATAYPISSGGIIDDDSAQAKTLVKVRPILPAGVPVYKATFASHVDGTVAGYTAATAVVTLGAAPAADDDINGGLFYVYEGPGAGEVNVIADSANGAATATMHRTFNATLTTSSKYIYLPGAAGDNSGPSLLSRVAQADQNNLLVNDASNDGPFVIYCSWHEIGNYLKNLCLPVVPAHYFYTAALSV